MDAAANVVILGAPNIGKTKMLDLLTGSQSIDIGPTLGIEMRTWAFKNKNGRVRRLRLWDTSGKNFYARLLRQDVHYSDIALLCVDTSNAKDLSLMHENVRIVEQSPVRKVVIIYQIFQDCVERKIMPADVLCAAEHARNRRNIKKIFVCEGRIEDTAMLREAFVVAAEAVAGTGACT
jgi:GTPase SAR1 family protein